MLGEQKEEEMDVFQDSHTDVELRRRTHCCDEASTCSNPSPTTARHLIAFEKVEKMVFSDYAKEQADQFVKKVDHWMLSWTVTHFYSLPEWLQDNDFLHHGYRPPLPSFSACFKSIFRLHTETINIWSHMIGCIAFMITAIYFWTHSEIELQEKLVFSAFFIGAIACLGLSCTFHTLNCHSERVGKLVCKLDYVGITLLIIGSFIPWIFYGFYCRTEPKITHLTTIVVLGVACLVVLSFDEFSKPVYRPIRAGLFMGLSLYGVVPIVHYLITEGYWSAVYEARFDALLCTALMYIVGSSLYAMRIPERFFPGKFDIWFQSHQLFHFFVLIAAFMHFQSMCDMALSRVSNAKCPDQSSSSTSAASRLFVSQS